MPFDGLIGVDWVKKRWRCAEPPCARNSFTEHTAQVPPRSRLALRLKDVIVDAVAGEVRAVDRLTRQFGVSWPTVQRLVGRAAGRLEQRRRHRPRLVRFLGTEEHRFRSVRWFQDRAGSWRRIEPWMTCLVDLATGEVIDVVDGRDSAAVAAWLQAQPRWWRRRVEVVAIDPSAPFRSAVRRWLPNARLSVDHFHIVKLANDMLTAVRRRVSWGRHDRRGRQVDPASAHRLLLLRGYDTRSGRGKDKLERVLRSNDPTAGIGAAWGIKEALRLTLMATTLVQARERKTRFDQYATWPPGCPRPTGWKKTIDNWWTEIETFITTRVTNAQTEAANVTHQEHQTHRPGYRSHTNYRSRIMLYNAARSVV